MTRIIRHRVAARMRDDERGFTLIELLVVMIMIGILAAIALAVFLNQQDKGKDAAAKSNVTNLARTMQACAAGSDQATDYRKCDTAPTIADPDFKIDPAAPNEINSGDCGDPNPGTDAPASGYDVRVLTAGESCFTIIGSSASGNLFWYVKHNDGSVSRDCTTRNQNGCPTDGAWAG